MTASLIGMIEPDVGSLSGKSDWVALIGAHPSLALNEPKQGINPFTKTPMSFQPPADAARVLVDGIQVGSIHWAMDDSRRLLVSSEAAAKSRVLDIANDIALRLGWHFVAHDHA